jgi:hypothetical protein
LTELEKTWREENRRKVQEFIAEMGDEGKCLRLQALQEQLQRQEDHLSERLAFYKKSAENGEPYQDREFVASFIADDEKHIEKLKRQRRTLLAEAQGKTRNDRITAEMIDRAREYPIESLIGTNGRRGNVLCIAHEETNPSMSLKGNRARCFSCGYFGDTIDVYMKLHGVGFVEAVRALQ